MKAKRRQGTGPLLLAAALLAAPAARGAAAPSPPGGEPEPRFTRPFVTADRATRTVRVEARATGRQSGRQREFLLVNEKGGHDYEAYAVTRAMPSDVHEALVFVGLRPGRPIDPRRLVFWPRGERVLVEIETSAPFLPAREGEPLPAAPEAPVRFRAEEAVLDTRTGRTLPPVGFAFVGSVFLEEDDVPGLKGYAADLLEPNAIVTLFNEPTTVLDIPRLGRKGELYDYQVINPARNLPEGAAVTVLLRPEAWDGGPSRNVDVTIGVHPGPTPGDPPVLSFEVAGRDPRRGGIGELRAAVGELRAAGFDVYARVRPAPEVTVGALVPFAADLDRCVHVDDLRVEPPEGDHLFYQAFEPDPNFRDRERRPSQPWELHLAPAGAAPPARLARLDTPYNEDDGSYGEPVEIARPVADPSEMPALSADGPDLPVLLVFAPRTTAYADVLRYVAPVRDRFPVVFVFADAP